MDHAARLGALARLAEMDAVLEIEGEAEHAIVAAGRSLGDVAREMAAHRADGDGSYAAVSLWDDGGRDHVSVRVIDGCICLEARLGPIEWTAEDGILVHEAFPESVTMALPGRPLRTLVKHPLLPGHASAEARRLPRDGAAIVDVILLDMALQHGTGLELVEALRADPSIAALPVIFFTASARDRDVRNYLAAGAVGVIPKPFDPISLAATVRALLGAA